MRGKAPESHRPTFLNELCSTRCFDSSVRSARSFTSPSSAPERKFTTALSSCKKGSFIVSLSLVSSVLTRSLLSSFPNPSPTTGVKYPLLRACSSSAALRAAGLQTHVRTHRTSSDPAYLHTYVYLYMKGKKKNIAISGIRA